jgi:hypothetical protein
VAVGDDGKPCVESAPKSALFSLEVLMARPDCIRLEEGDVLVLCDRVRYLVNGWDACAKAVTAVRLHDARQEAAHGD